jgi:hypothetical protein
MLIAVLDSLLLCKIHFTTPNALELRTMAMHLGFKPNSSQNNEAKSISSLQKIAQFLLHCIPKAKREVQKQSNHRFSFLASFATLQASRYHIIITLGKDGVIVASSARITTQKPEYLVEFTHVPSKRIENIVNTSGAGDTLAGATIWCLIRTIRESNLAEPGTLRSCAHSSVVKAVHCGISAACLTLKSDLSVAKDVRVSNIIANAST